MGQNPQYLAYLGGMQNIKQIPPSFEHSFPHKCKEEAKLYALSQIENKYQILWPHAYHNGTFNWTILTDPKNRVGMARFDAQYWRHNVNPSDHYVQILTKHFTIQNYYRWCTV